MALFREEQGKERTTEFMLVPPPAALQNEFAQGVLNAPTLPDFSRQTTLFNGPIIIDYSAQILADPHPHGATPDQLLEWRRRNGRNGTEFAEQEDDTVIIDRVKHADELMMQGQFQAAWDEYNLAVQADGADAVAIRIHQAFVFSVHTHSIETTHYLYDHAISLDPQRIDAYLAKAQSYLVIAKDYRKREQMQTEALQVYNMAIHNNPRSVELLLERARLLDTMWQFEGAYNDYLEIFRLDPNQRQKLQGEFTIVSIKSRRS